jgi:hypothetical protein
MIISGKERQNDYSPALSNLAASTLTGLDCNPNHQTALAGGLKPLVER